MAERRLVNVAELPRGAEFVNLPPGIERLDFSGLPANALERFVKKPKIARYRAALGAVLASDGMPIVSHLPRMTAAVCVAQALTRQQAPHLAFSFNFTDLPEGMGRRYMTAAFGGVDEFFVYSDYEREAYPRYFSQPQERFRSLLWAQSPPAVAAGAPPFEPNTYVSAVGGEGRDYASLVRAAELLPDIEFVIIARPRNQVRSFPKNVRLLMNVPADLTWRIALESSCLVVPLKSRTTCCGHITLVAGELLGIPLISTRSEATREYTKDVALCEPGDVGELAKLIRQHHHEASDLKRASRARVPAKIAKYDRKHWDLAVWTSLARYM